MGFFSGIVIRHGSIFEPYGKVSPKMTLKNEFSWSKSRDELFRECPRKYYYAKYGFWGGWEWDADERTRKLYVLRNLKSRHMWVGEKLHQEIERILGDTRSGKKPTIDVSVERVRTIMRREFQDSKNRLYWKNPKRFPGLYEHEYEVDLSDEKWRGLFEGARECVINFIESEEFAMIRSVQVDKWLPIEEFLSMDVDRIKVFVKIDFAYRFNNLLRVVDWKTGESKDADSTVQMRCYCLFAKEKWHEDERHVESREVNIRTGETRTNRIESKAELDWISHYIKNSANVMLDLLDDRDRNVARMEKFQRTKDENNCKWCNFRKVCESE